MAERYFAGLVPGRSRTAKPRENGRTMVIDWGIGPRRQSDLLETGAEFFDLAKIAVGIGSLLPADVFRAKVELYQAHAVEPFPGGQFLEAAEMHGTADAYFPACAEAGYRWIEVSDNLAPVSLDWKREMIRRAVEDFGFRVLGEVGKKEGLGRNQTLVEDAQVCLEAGADIILLEAAEIIGESAVQEVEDVVATVPTEMLMFELPGPWIDGVHACDIHRLRRELIARFGPDVNIGNVDPADLVAFEAFRQGLGVNAGGAQAEPE